MNISTWRNKKIAIWGWGKEGTSCAHFLHKQNISFWVINDYPLSLQVTQKINQMFGAQVKTGFDHKDLLFFDIVVKSPGISLYHPKLLYAQQQGVVFTSATNIWFYHNRKNISKIITVTGTKGKSTTASLIAYFLRKVGYKTILAGNIGKPLLSFTEVKDVDFWVVELSSYQIADLKYSGQVNVFLNLYPEHIDWHQNLNQYYEDKLNIIRRARGKHVIVNCNESNKNVLSAIKRKKYILRYNHPRSVHLKNNFIYDGNKTLITTSEIPLIGKHNQLNLCAALSVLKLHNISLKNTIHHALTFKALPHRLNNVGCYKKVTYINDSISTTPESALAAIDSFSQQKIIIILGGMDRELDWESFALKLIKLPLLHIILMYESGKKIYSFLKKYNCGHCQYVANLKKAVKLARQISPINSIVLLSPAAPSYDAFRNFEDRGKCFQKYIATDDAGL